MKRKKSRSGMKFTGMNKIFRSKSLQEMKEQSEDGVFHALWRDWKWIFSFTKKRKWLVFVYTLMGIVLSSFSLLVAYINKILINNVVKSELSGIVLLGVAYVFCIAVNIAANAVVNRLSQRITIYINNDIQDLIFSRVIDAKWSDVSSYKTGDLLNRLNDDVSTIASNAVNWLPSIIINGYTFVITFIVLWQMDRIMALISLLAAPFLVFISRYLMKLLQTQRKKVSELNSDMISFENDALSNYDMIKSFGVTDFYSRQFSDWHDRYESQNLTYNKVQIRSNIIMSAASSAVSIAAFGYCLFRLSTGTLLYGDMSFFLTQRGNVSARFNNLINAIPGLLNSAVAAQRIRELVELEPEQHDSHALEELSNSDGITVRFHNVSFAYNENARIYDGGNFVAKPGEIVTILGPSGEGKTTLLRMILGLISPESGDVMLIGSDGKELPMNADLRKLISYVPQGNTTVIGTIADNMRMVKENATDEEIEEALKTACAWDFVKELPDGIHTYIGGNAHGISTGQAQRISIARAILRNSPILILDEATSALDTKTEEEVLHNIVAHCPNKTCIVSTHRPSILKASNRVYRLENKKLICYPVE